MNLFSHRTDREIKWMLSFVIPWVWNIPMLCDTIVREIWTNIYSLHIGNWGPTKAQIPPKSIMSFTGVMYRIVGEGLFVGAKKKWFKDSYVPNPPPKYGREPIKGGTLECIAPPSGSSTCVNYSSRMFSWFKPFWQLRLPNYLSVILTATVCLGRGRT